MKKCFLAILMFIVAIVSFRAGAGLWFSSSHNEPVTASSEESPGILSYLQPGDVYAQLGCERCQYTRMGLAMQCQVKCSDQYDVRSERDACHRGCYLSMEFYDSLCSGKLVD